VNTRPEIRPLPPVRARRSGFVRVALTMALTLALALGVLPASAQNKVETAAKALQKKAMEEDYLATEFTKAQDKLEKAVAQCGADKCSGTVRSQLRRDLGVVQIGGQIDKEKGITNFMEAMKADAAVALDPDLRTKDLDAAWAEAKKRLGGGGATPATAGGARPSADGQPSGDFSHTPAAEQTIRTPIPVYAEYSGEEQLVKVIVRYKGFGMTEWKTVELRKMGDKGWGALLPCTDVQQGTTQYYLQGFNAQNDPVATGGDRNNAYKVPVKREKVAEAPHLPGQPAPAQCADTGDCPPNFPGCKKAPPPGKVETAEVTGKDGGEFCEEDTECRSKTCSNNKCTEPEGEKKAPKFWLGLSGSFDYSLVSSAEDVCKLSTTREGQLPLNDQNYYCTNTNGSDYPFRQIQGVNDPRNPENDNLVVGTSNRVSGGGTIGNIRIMATLDYALSMNVLLGARIGYVANSYPGKAAGDDGKTFPPIHLELRGTFLIGKDALIKKLAPYVMAGAGVATWDASVKVGVVERVGTVNTPRQADAWQIAGPGFFAVGGGARIGFSPRVAMMAGARINLAFGNAFVPSAGPELGIQFGF